MKKSFLIKQYWLAWSGSIAALITGFNLPALAIAPLNLPTHGYNPDSTNTRPNVLGVHFDRNNPLPGQGGTLGFEMTGGINIAPSNTPFAIGDSCGTDFKQGIASTQLCRFTDSDNFPNVPYHFEVLIKGPAAPFNIRILTPSNRLVGGLFVPIPANQSFLVEAIFHELPTRETGNQLNIQYWTNLPASIPITWSLVENPQDPGSNPPPPILPGNPQRIPCPTTNSSVICNGVGSNPWAGPVDPSLPTLDFCFPEDANRFSASFNPCAVAVPEPPATLGLLILSLLGAGSLLLRQKNDKN